MANTLPSSVYLIKIGYWCDLTGYPAEMWETQAKDTEMELSKQHFVLDAVWSERQSPVFEIEIDLGSVTSLDDLNKYDATCRKIIAKHGMKIAE